MTHTIDVLRNEHGAFSMLAIDQRESLRAMLANAADGADIPDSDLVAFKTTVATELTDAASALLIDRDYGIPAAHASKSPVILAADILSASVPGGGVDTALLDPEVNAEVAMDARAAALKMLVPWTPETREGALQLAVDFMGLCHELGLPGIVEGVVRPRDIAEWSDERRNDAIVQAAIDLAPSQPDLYKAEIPSYGRGDLDVITEVSARITDAIGCPWVVLSSGVRAKDFPDAVAACRKGGAQGFLAGRAIWADAIAAADTDEFLATTSRERLMSLAAATA